MKIKQFDYYICGFMSHLNCFKVFIAFTHLCFQCCKCAHTGRSLSCLLRRYETHHFIRFVFQLECCCCCCCWNCTVINSFLIYNIILSTTKNKLMSEHDKKKNEQQKIYKTQSHALTKGAWQTQKLEKKQNYRCGQQQKKRCIQRKTDRKRKPYHKLGLTGPMEIKLNR